MTIKKIFAALILAVMIVTFIALTGTKTSVEALAGKVAPELEGSWEVTVTSGSDQFTSLATFDRGGGMVVVNPNRDTSTGHGNWVKIGDHQYAVTFVYILRSPPGFVDIGTVKVRALVSLNPKTDSFDGPQQAIVTIGGNEVDSSCGAVQATRIDIEPPDCP